jgi:hypothetical protein
MKKVLSLMLIASFVFISAACTNSNDTKLSDDLVLSSSVVKEGVRGWGVYTNPAYRYELRHPKSWSPEDSGEDGKVAWFTPKGNQVPAVRILSYSNWREQYDLQNFYQNQSVNLLESEYKQEEIEIGGFKGYRFEQVKERAQGDYDAADVIALDLVDRIIEVELIEINEDSRMLLNSLKFYGNKTVSDLK